MRKVALLIVLVALAALGLILWLLPRSPSSAGSSSMTSNQAMDRATRGQSPTTPTPAPTATASLEDSELRSLQERLSKATPAEQPKVLADLETAEGKYRNDYRFSYERAKYLITESREHHKAFEALFLAGQKAIDNNKADEMLSELTRDKSGVFFRLSRGHSEWKTLENALKTGDKSALKIEPHR